MQNTIVTISSRNSFGFAQRLARETLLVMQSMQALKLLKNVALFVLKMAATHHTPAIIAQSRAVCLLSFPSC
jgi:hypothetical protein